MNESEIGNRVSKSDVSDQKDTSVKEQRVSGSYNFMKLLRYTLVSLERRYQFKILSNQSINRHFLNLSNSKFKRYPSEINSPFNN